MKKPFAISKNRICAVLLIAVLFILCTPFAAFAAETTLTTTVPQEMDLTLEIVGKGQIEVDGNVYTKNAVIKVNQHTKAKFTITPNQDYELKSVSYNGENVISELQENVFMAQEFENNFVLKVVFALKGDTPETGDNSPSLWIYIALMAVSVTGNTFAMKKRKA